MLARTWPHVPSADLDGYLGIIDAIFRIDIGLDLFKLACTVLGSAGQIRRRSLWNRSGGQPADRVPTK